MPEQPKLTAKEAGSFSYRLDLNEFVKGSHYIYKRDSIRVVIPFHSEKTFHPKIVKQVLDAIDF